MEFRGTNLYRGTSESEVPERAKANVATNAFRWDERKWSPGMPEPLVCFIVHTKPSLLYIYNQERGVFFEKVTGRKVW